MLVEKKSSKNRKSNRVEKNVGHEESQGLELVCK